MTFQQLVQDFIGIISTAIPIVAALALLFFFIGLVKFITNVSGDTKAVKEGKDLMIWGIIALFIMVSFWGIIRFIHNDLSLGSTIGLPLLPPQKP